MSGPASAAAYAMPVDWPERAPDRHPDTLLWIARIEAVRRHLDPPTTRRCSGPCGDDLPLEDFARSNTRGSGGRAYICKRCKAGENRERYRQRKVTQFRAILGRAS